MAWSYKSGREVVQNARVILGDLDPRTPALPPATMGDFLRRAVPEVIQSVGWRDDTSVAVPIDIGQHEVVVLAGEALLASPRAYWGPTGTELQLRHPEVVRAMQNNDLQGGLGSVNRSHPQFFAIEREQGVFHHTNTLLLYPAAAVGGSVSLHPRTEVMDSIDDLNEPVYLDHGMTSLVELRIASWAAESLAPESIAKLGLSPNIGLVLSSRYEAARSAQAARFASFRRGDRVIVARG